LIPSVRNDLFKKVEDYLPSSKSYVHVGMAVGLTLFVIFVLGNPEIFSIVDRKRLVDEFGFIHTLSTTFIVISTVCAFSVGSNLMFTIGIVVVLFDILWLGSRELFACVFISTTVIYMSEVGRVKLVSKWRTGTLLLAIGAFIFMIKFSYVHLKKGDLNAVFEQLQSRWYYFRVFLLSEPAVNQAVLNRVVETQFKLPISSLFDSLYFLSPAHRLFGPIEATSFKDLYQPKLFPQVQKGMANNIWAEMYAVGGYGFVILFTFILSSIVACSNHFLYLSRKNIIKSVIAISFFYTCFFVNRSDLNYLLSRIRIVVFTFIVMSIISFIYEVVINSISPIETN
jgi:hypothetical protein